MTNNYFWTGNYHNIDELELDTPIYRIFKKEHFSDMLQNNRNTLAKPKLWDDPWENFLSSVFGWSFLNNLYGQCWTLTPESDCMWRVYSADKSGVKVKTTIKKLLCSLYGSIGDQGVVEAHIGKVIYSTDKDIENDYKMVELVSTGHTEVKQLFRKRLEFEHEQEVRLVYNAADDYNAIDNLKTYPIDFNTLIDEIILDPRMDKTLAEALKLSISKYKQDKKIVESKLYKIPSFSSMLV